MALKGFRDGNLEYDLSCFMNQANNRGGICTMVSTSLASGSAMDQGTNLVSYAYPVSGLKVAGMLLCDVVDIDQSKYHKNYQKDEVVKGGKVTLATKGRFVTNMLKAGTTPTYGASAYVTESGLLTPTKDSNGGLAATPIVGRFLGVKDEDGYVKVEINITNVT